MALFLRLLNVEERGGSIDNWLELLDLPRNRELKFLRGVSTVLQEDTTEESVVILQMIVGLKFCPLRSCDVQRTFSAYKNPYQ